MPLDLPPSKADIDRFIPADSANVAWVQQARQSYAFDMGSVLRGALRDLKLDRGRVAFDDMGSGFRLGVEGMQVVDGYDPLMFARAVKTDTELRLLERSTRLNETAIRRTMASWQKGATWRDLNKAYAGAVTDRLTETERRQAAQPDKLAARASRMGRWTPIFRACKPRQAAPHCCNGATKGALPRAPAKW